jgi:hypothetical protein
MLILGLLAAILTALATLVVVVGVRRGVGSLEA